LAGHFGMGDQGFAGNRLGGHGQGQQHGGGIPGGLGGLLGGPGPGGMGGLGGMFGQR
jgi:hypothetical protein